VYALAVAERDIRLMRFRFIATESANHGIPILCRCLRSAPPAFAIATFTGFPCTRSWTRAGLRSIS